jgi:hypothetical protein
MGEIDRPPAPKASASGSAGGGTLNGAEADRFQRGLDSGLAKAAPSATGLNQKIYQSHRRRLDLFVANVSEGAKMWPSREPTWFCHSCRMWHETLLRALTMAL